METIKLANGQLLEKRDQTVGPRHDPYGRTIVTRFGAKTEDPDVVRERGFEGYSFKRFRPIIRPIIWELVSCGLAGEYLEHDGNKIEMRDFFGSQYTMSEHDAMVKQARQEYEAKVIEVTGFGSGFWLHKVWAQRDHARWRAMTPQQRYEYEMCMEADEALLSYAM
jgi:hypothetical protein